MRIRVLAVLALALLGSGCATTKFLSTWTEPGRTKPLDMSGKKVAAFMLTHKKNLREATEDLLARRLSEGGSQGIAGYTLVNEDGEPDSAKVLDQLRSKGIDGAVILRPVSKMNESDIVPGQVWYTGGYYSTFSGYWGYGSYDPVVEGNTVFMIETMVYSVSDNQLLWSGISKTTQPKDLEKFVYGLADAAAKEMKKSGLLPK